MNKSRLDDLNVYIDVKPRLSIAQISIHSENISQKTSGFDISVTPNGLSIAKNETISVDVTVKDLSMLPLTCNGLQFTNSDEIQWRLQIDKFKEMKLKNVEYIDPGPDETLSSEQTDLMLFQQSLFHAKCHNCGAVVINRNKPFSRVRPLPSDDWTEVMENVYCCKHPSNTNGDASSHSCNSEHEPRNSRLVPEKNECFVGEEYFLLSSQDLREYDGLVMNGEDVICQRCRHVIGKIKLYPNGQSSFQIRHHSIRITHSMTAEIEKAILLSSTKIASSELYVSSLLLSQVKIYNNFRFILECKLHGKFKPYILLWFMDKDGYVCSGKVSADEPLKPEPVVKILYDSASKNNKLCDLWMKDSTVQCIDLPHTLCSLLLRRLIDSTKMLPPSLRYLNGFHVGHIRR